MKKVDTDLVGKNFNDGKDGAVDNRTLIAVNDAIRNHQVEQIGSVLRKAMTAMKAIKTA
jgi:ketol-acid reductoisomerase